MALKMVPSKSFCDAQIRRAGMGLALFLAFDHCACEKRIAALQIRESGEAPINPIGIN
jgi:hypothetical protein